MYNYKHTKIVATLSPSVATPDVLSEFINSGVNVFRLNFSHGSHEEYIQMIEAVNQVRSQKNTNTAILQDLQGPRVRVSQRDAPLEVEIGDEVFLTYEKETYTFADSANILSLDHNLTNILQEGEKVLIEDGLIELLIKEIVFDEQYAVCEAQTNSSIKGRKGVNFPGSSAEFPVITEKDKQDLKFGLSQNIDVVAMSFVRSADDIRNLKALIDEYRPNVSRPLIFAKIEKPDAVDRIQEILEEVDGIMVARGDLGIEVEAEKVPIIQKQLIHEAMLHGKRVIVATQMLDSMIRNPRPTRAEVSDVANAVIDHTDAVMLSGETSGGIYPLQAVEMMRRIIMATEESTYDDYVDEYFQIDDIKNIHRELSYGAQHLARQSEAHGIVVFDWEGVGIAEYMAEFRTEVPVFAITANSRYYYQTGLTWGVTGVLIDDLDKSEMHIALNLVKNRYFKRSDQEEQYFVVVDITHKNKESIQMYLV